MGRIYTSYFSNWRNFPESCVTISIAQLLKDWINVTYECRSVAPTKDLLFKYINGKIDKEEYKKLYLKQLSSNKEKFNEFLDLIVHEAKEKDVILLCYEKTGDFCHRNILRTVINKIFKRHNLQEVVEL